MLYGNDMDLHYDLQRNKENVLVITPPAYHRKFDTYAARPNVYNFDEEFVHNMKTAAFEYCRSNRRDKLIRITKSPDLIHTYNTSSRPDFIFDLDELDDKFLFMLDLKDVSVNDNNFSRGGFNNSVYNKFRCLYYGYFTDEPLDSKHHINPNAYMIITHRTVLSLSESQDRNGHLLQNNCVVDNDIIIPTESLKCLRRNRDGNQDYMFHLTSENSAKHFLNANDFGDEVEYNIPVQNTPSVSNSLNYNKNTILHKTALNRPKEHIKGLMGVLTDVITNETLDNDSVDDILDRKEHLSSNIETAFTLHGNTVSVNDHIGPPLNRPIKVDNIFDDYDPKVVRNNVEFDIGNGMGRVDQTQASMTNAYYTMVATSLHALMSTYGVNTLTFSYDSSYSYNANDDQDNYSNGVDIDHYSTMYDLYEEEKYKAVNAVITELRYSVFNLIQQQIGQFKIRIHADLVGTTVINISGYDFDTRDNELYTCTNSLGGLLSPTIGNGVSLENNASQLSNLFSEVLGDDRTIEPRNVLRETQLLNDHSSDYNDRPGMDLEREMTRDYNNNSLFSNI